MICKKSNGVPWYQFENLARFSELWHGFFTRNGGSSKPPYHSLNISFGVGDDPESVTRNRKQISGVFGGRRLIFASQVHQTNILTYAADGNGGPCLFPDQPETGDGMVTDAVDSGLAIGTADCQAVLLYDAARGVVANVHAGWRGSVQNIVGKTVGVMMTRFGSKPVDIFAGIGPSLGPCCAEFIHYQNEFPEECWAYGDTHKRFDFWALSRDQLLRAGVPEEHLEFAGYCTRCRTDLFFSYRGEGVTGRTAAVIGLKG